MNSHMLQPPRPQPRLRLSAYECSVLQQGQITQGRYVTGWYGPFSIERLTTALMPKLAERVRMGRGSYPFLVISHVLEPDIQDGLQPFGVGGTSEPRDIFEIRHRRTPRLWRAVVFSSTDYELLPLSTNQ